MAQAMASGLQNPKPEPGARQSQAKHGLWPESQASTLLVMSSINLLSTFFIITFFSGYVLSGEICTIRFSIHCGTASQVIVGAAD